MEPHHVNLEDILKMPDSEFKQNFREWLENDGVARSLQAKLRKDLIDTFNKTNLGRKIFFQHQKSSRVMLSPLILAINTLVAEFLYAQHCHYSLSVFSTEVPYRNILPDFENSDQFRFSQEELVEIFDAVSGDIDPDLKSTIIAQYLSGSEKANRSLLYLILKNFFRKFEQPEKVAEEPKKVFENKQIHEESSQNEPKKSKKDSYQMAYNTHFRYLNKYLVILSRKVKEMAQNLEQLQRREGDAKNVRRKTLRHRKLERLNRSLEKISENLRHLSFSKRKTKNVSVILTAVNKMAQQFEKCAYNFEAISRKIGGEKRDKWEPNQEKSYSEWIAELKCSKNGRKFMLKVENSLRKALEREKQKMQEDFDVQLESQKELIRLKYKQKLLQQIGKHSSKEEDESSEEAKKLVNQKLKELDKKHHELLQRLLESEKRVKNSPKSANIQEELIPTKSVAVITDKPKFRSTSTETEKPRIEKGKKKQTQTTENDLAIKPQLEEMAKTIAEHERNIDHIVFDAKLRIQELEYESNQLERSFQEYLKRQKETKEHVEDSVTTIWEKYNFEKIMLNKKSEAFRASRSNLDQLRLQRDFSLGYSVPNIPAIEINAGDGNIRASAPDITAFDNPFRKLKQEMLFRGDLFRPEPKTHSVKDDIAQNVLTSRGDKSKSPEQGNSSEENKNLTIEDKPKSSRNSTEGKKNLSIEDKPKSPGSIAEGKKNLLLVLSQKPSTVTEITHEKTISKDLNTTLNFPSKIEEIMKISPDRSGLSSDINLKDISLDEINISGSRSSSNKSDEKIRRSGPNCRRSLFHKMDQTSVVEKWQEKTGAVPKNVERKLLEPNIFEPSSFSKIEKESSNETNVISNQVEIVEAIKTADLRLDLPETSPKTVSSSNSISASFKLNLSVGHGDASGSEDFWS